MNVIEQEIITRENVINNPDIQYLFGDNLEGWGKGGQAIIRGLPNAIGIPTKKAPRRDKDAYFNDKEYESNTKAIDRSFRKIDETKDLVIPSSGLGTGLADLENRAPKTFKYLQDRIDQLISFASI